MTKLIPQIDCMKIGYDIETYINVFTLCARDVITGDRWQFEISPRVHQGVELVQWLQWLSSVQAAGIGYNNVHFDYTILHFILERGGNVSAYEIFLKKEEIFKAFNQWEHTVYNPVFPQIDLYKIHHFDNAAKRTSLKMVECNMRSLKIKDLPFDPSQPVPIEYIDFLIVYNWHDVDETIKFYWFSENMVNFRFELAQRYVNDNFINFNDTKVGEQVFIDKLEAANIQCFEYINNRRSPRQTHRPEIHLNQAVFDYIQFKRPEFQAVTNWFKQQVITSTKGVFANIVEHRLGDVALFANMRERKGPAYTGQQVPPAMWVDKQKNGKEFIRYRQADSLNVSIDGFEFVFGAGGIHGSIESSVVHSDDDYIIIDLDVASYYPNLGIVNRLYPAHLGDAFCDIYKALFEERRSYDKGTAENAMLKLALNGVYGKSKSEYSCFYDPLYTMSITINGQLLLCMLAEWLLELPGVTMIQANTDGVTIRAPRNQQNAVAETAKRWEQFTCLELESVDYQTMAIRDVNNYIAVDMKGKVKRKGCYGHELSLDNPNTLELAWHKNHSNRVVALAAQAALVDGVSIREFIMNHDDIFDFCSTVKLPRTMRLELRFPDGRCEVQENITRYYVTNNGGSLIKVMPPIKGKEAAGERENSIEAGWQVQPVNDLNNDYRGDICHEYYIQETQKIVTPLLT